MHIIKQMPHSLSSTEKSWVWRKATLSYNCWLYDFTKTKVASLHFQLYTAFTGSDVRNSYNRQSKLTWKKKLKINCWQKAIVLHLLIIYV